MTHRTVPLDLLVRVRGYLTEHTKLCLDDPLLAELTAQIEQHGHGEPVAWRCFHCDEVFTTIESARLHFGVSLLDKPACQIDVAHLRGMESQLARYREEDTDLHREIYRLISKHRRELVTEEEKGYARGLRDATPQDSVPAVAIEFVRAKDTHEAITKAVIDGLYYFDNRREIEAIGTYDGTLKAVAKGIQRYREDAEFHAKVDAMAYGVRRELESRALTLAQTKG